MAPAERDIVDPPPAEELARALLPGLLRTVERARHALEDAARGPRATALSALEEEREATRGLGWTLAVLAAAGGAELAEARREEDGLRLFAGHVACALAERGVVLAPGAARLPALRGDAGGGWPPALAVGTFLWLAGRDRTPGPLRWRGVAGEDSWALALADAGPGPDLRDAVRGIPGTRVVAEGRGAPRLELPAAWVAGG